MSKKRNRISKTNGWVLLIVAMGGDILQFFIVWIPFIGGFFNSIISILLFITFWVWYRFLGLSMFRNHGRFVAKTGATLVEMLPFVNAIPSWTIITMYTIRSVRNEDEKHNVELKAANDNTPNDIKKAS